MDEQIAGLLKISDLTPVMQIVHALQFNPTALSFQRPKRFHLQVIRSSVVIDQNDEPDASSGSGALTTQIDKISGYLHQLQEGWPVHHAELAQSQQRRLDQTMMAAQRGILYRLDLCIRNSFPSLTTEAAAA
jgi:hypothetical protein